MRVEPWIFLKLFFSAAPMLLKTFFWSAAETSPRNPIRSSPGTASCAGFFAGAASDPGPPSASTPTTNGEKEWYATGAIHGIDKGVGAAVRLLVAQ